MNQDDAPIDDLDCVLTVDDGPEGDERIVIVCEACEQACCWQGKFMCDDARHAGTAEKTIRELKILDLENPCYWEGK
jgi:hypothetical protein